MAVVTLLLCFLCCNGVAAASDALNPTDDNIFLHLTPQQSRDHIIVLIYLSFWLGALGWDIFSTLNFDWRIVRETNWRSVFSVVNSLTYFVSRYTTFAWILRTILEGLTKSENCRSNYVASASLYGVCVCSSE